MTNQDRQTILERRRQKVFCDQCGAEVYGLHPFLNLLLCHRCYRRMRRQARAAIPEQLSFADLAEGASFAGDRV